MSLSETLRKSQKAAQKLQTELFEAKRKLARALLKENEVAVAKLAAVEIDTRPLSKRAKRALATLGIKSVADLAALAPLDVLKQPGIGRVTFRELNIVRTAHGLPPFRFGSF